VARDVYASNATRSANALRAFCRSWGESISRHHSPRTLAVSTGALCAISWITERYHCRIASGRRTASSSAVVKILGPEPRNESSPIDSPPITGCASHLSIASRRPCESIDTFMSSASYVCLWSIASVIGADGESSTRASTPSSKIVSPFKSRKSSDIAPRASQQLIRLSELR
jgi:hypothetical protein